MARKVNEEKEPDYFDFHVSALTFTEEELKGEEWKLLGKVMDYNLKKRMARDEIIHQYTLTHTSFVNWDEWNW